jgi:voltage-gated potassium channel
VYSRLEAEGVAVTIVEARPDLTHAPEGTVVGSGAETDTLEQAGIHDAVGIVAGTDHDANNLSIIMTARALNPHLFMVGRQNFHHNDTVFRAAKLDLTMTRGNVIANKLFALLTTPLLADFLWFARQNGDEWANQLVSRIGGIAGDEVPQTWSLAISPALAPAMYLAIAEGMRPTVGDLQRDPRNREQSLPCMVLLIKRESGDILLPDDDTPLQRHDRILLCGRHGASLQMEWIARNHNVLRYVHSGEEHPSGTLWRWFTRKSARKSGKIG